MLGEFIECFLTIIGSLKLVYINKNYFAVIMRISVLDLGYIYA